MTRHDLARSSTQLGSILGSARLCSAGYSGFGSSRLLAQARLGAPDLGSGINTMLSSAQLETWLGLSSHRLGSRDSGFGLARLGAQIDLSRTESTSADIGYAHLSSHFSFIKETIHKRKQCETKTARIANAYIDDKPLTKKMLD